MEDGGDALMRPATRIEQLIGQTVLDHSNARSTKLRESRSERRNTGVLGAATRR